MKRPIAKSFSPGAVVAMEPLVDRIVTRLCDRLEERFIDSGEGKECDLGSWIAYCTWDIIGAATLSEDFGYLHQGSDHDGSINLNDRFADYFGTVGQIPFVDTLLDKNPLVRLGPPTLENVASFTLRHIQARVQGRDPHYNPAMPDFLQHFLDTREEKPDAVDEQLVFSYTVNVLLAGADTSAIAIRAVMYFVLCNRRVWDRLSEELLATDWEGPVAPFSTARALPYLEAVVRESMRLHPSVTMLLERYVPDTGLTLPDGSFVPPKTAVGINPYVSSRNKSIWGPDADAFCPERWLPRHGESTSDESFRARLRLFNASDLTFGGGSRVCIGRHVALVEIYKTVATIVKRYDIELADPGPIKGP
ncbi:hypothetical protein CDD83_8550 [Cordyceps sp. RAO-2017]|nr:hypothetical protein CDD83_8550 [Cordyceps sp. RAO-2017]